MFLTKRYVVEIFCCLSKKLGVLGSWFFHTNSQEVTIIQKGKGKVLETISIYLTS